MTALTVAEGPGVEHGLVLARACAFELRPSPSRRQKVRWILVKGKVSGASAAQGSKAPVAERWTDEQEHDREDRRHDVGRE